MKFSDIKFGLYALVLGAASLMLYTYNNLNAYELYKAMIDNVAGSEGDINAGLISGVTKYPLVFAAVGTLTGIIALINKSKFRIVGLIISTIALILSFFPVWTIFIK